MAINIINTMYTFHSNFQTTDTLLIFNYRNKEHIKKKKKLTIVCRSLNK